MEVLHISLPNSPDNFLLMEMCERLKEGQEVTMLFGGRSMLPMINGTGDKIRLRPLKIEDPCKIGEIYLFFHCGHYVIHRLMRINNGTHIFRGDNCYKFEEVPKEQVLAKLVAVIQPDGTEIDCEGDWWHKRSREVLRRRKVRNLIAKYGNSIARRKWAWHYFAVLAILMWAPLNGLGIPLDNFIFGLRLDHLLHASVYLFCPLFLMDILNYRKGWILLAAVAIGLFTEFVQYLLPFRGFDINDLFANAVGSFIGWLLIMPLLRRHRK